MPNNGAEYSLEQASAEAVNMVKASLQGEVGVIVILTRPTALGLIDGHSVYEVASATNLSEAMATYVVERIKIPDDEAGGSIS